MILNKLLTTAPDYQQPWIMEPSISQRNLCTPTAFASQFRSFYNSGFISDMPINHPYTPGAIFNQRGWMDFAFDGPAIPNPGTWNAVSSYVNPAFSWWFNTNNQGATDLISTIGTTVENAIHGAQQVYSRTSLAGKWGAMFHKGGYQTFGVLPYNAPASIASSMHQSWTSIKASIDR